MVMLHVIYDWQRDRIFQVKQFHKSKGSFVASVCVCIPSLSVRTSIHVLPQARAIADIRGRCVSYAAGIQPGCDVVPQWWNSAHGVTHLPSFYVNSPLLVVVLLVHKTADRRKCTHAHYTCLNMTFDYPKCRDFTVENYLHTSVSGDNWQQFTHLLCAVRINYHICWFFFRWNRNAVLSIPHPCYKVR